MIRKGDIIEIISNPRPTVALTEKYVGEPAEILTIINEQTLLIKFCDERQLTVDVSCVKEL
jgi:hypothetical protein